MDTRQYNLAPRLTAESPAKIRGARTDMSGKSQLRPIHACFCDALALRKACINENMRFFAAPCIAGAQGLLLRAKERQEKQRLGKTVHVTYTVDAAQGFAADCPVWPKSRGHGRDCSVTICAKHGWKCIRASRVPKPASTTSVFSILWQGECRSQAKETLSRSLQRVLAHGLHSPCPERVLALR